MARICPSCGRRPGGDLTVCMQCGADLVDRVPVRAFRDPGLPPPLAAPAWVPPLVDGPIQLSTRAAAVRWLAVVGQGLIAAEYGSSVLFRGMTLLAPDGSVVAIAGMIVPAFLAWMFVRRMVGVWRRYDRDAFADLRALNVVVTVLLSLGTLAAIVIQPSLAAWAAIDVALVLGAVLAAEAAARILPSGRPA